MTQRLSDKHPSEFVQVSFDYTKDLAVGENVTSVISLDVTVESGTDASPSAILNGAYAIQSPFVIQPVRNGLDSVDYHFACLAQTDRGNRFMRQAVLPIRKKTSPR